MTIARSANFKEANKILSVLNQEAAQAALNNLQSDSVHLEDTYCFLLNCLYDYELVSTNTVKTNYEGIDLIDEKARVCIQVTADTSAAKMRKTLSKQIMKDLAERNYSLRFCFVGEQNRNVKRRRPENPYGIKFDATEDTFLTSDILRDFNHLSIERQEEFLALLKRETSEGYIISRDWLNECFTREAKLLGPRYTPEANVETPDLKKLFAISGRKEYREELFSAVKLIEKALKTIGRLSGKERKAWNLVASNEQYASIKKIVRQFPGQDSSLSEFENWALDFELAINKALSLTSQLEQQARSGVGSFSAIREFVYSVDYAERACFSYGVSFLRSKRVLIYGEAGIGKSHLLADLCGSLEDEHGVAVMLLGSQFYGAESSEEDIPRILNLEGSLDNFLSELQRYAETRDIPALLVIDALNEGGGRSFWRYALPSLFEKAAQYSRVRIVLSVRSTYFDDVVPCGFVEDEDYQCLECKGFGYDSRYALESYCEYYDITYPLMPIIGLEFSNPLYLKLLCEYVKNHGGTFVEGVAMDEVIKDFIDEVNQKLADIEAVGYDRQVPLVRKALGAIVASPDFSYGYILYENASKQVNCVVSDYVNPPGKFLEFLVSEGMLSVVGDRQNKYLVFSYELVGNFIVAMTLAEKANALQAERRHANCIESLNELLHTNWNWIIEDAGALAALSSILPSACGCELFELNLDFQSKFSEARKAFVDGLLWRSRIEITPSLDSFIREYVLRDGGLARTFFLLSFQFVSRRYGINIEYFSSLLLAEKMPQRDYFWSSAAATHGNAMAFVDWVWAKGCSLDGELVMPVAKLLTFCLAVTNLPMRRKAMKALALVLINRPDVAESLWRVFSVIDDDYILEGLLGSIYGAIVNSKKLIDWEGVAEATYATIINNGQAYPNIAVRDFATLLYKAVFEDSVEDDSFNDAYCSGFYSDWFENLPTNEEIDTYVESIVADFDERSYEKLGIDRIVHSMTTEYGRGCCRYGDFGRYTLGSRLSLWKNQFDDQLLSNAVLYTILREWYIPAIHAEYDYYIKRFEGRVYLGCERIGKKYQKIGLNQLVARLVDNYPPIRIEKQYKEDYDKYRSERNASIQKAIISGCDSKLPEFNEEDWVAKKEYALRSTLDVENELLRFRSFDPSFPWRWSEVVSSCELASLYPSVIEMGQEPSDWCQSGAEWATIESYRVRVVDGTRYYVLGALVDWEIRRDGKRCREAIWLSCAFFLDSDDFNGVFGKYSSPSEIQELWYVRFGEYCDGAGFAVSDALYRSERDDMERQASSSCYLYGWEMDRIDLGEETDVCVPCESLVHFFGLKRHGSLTWISENGEVMAFCCIDQETKNHSLLFNADALDAYLQSKGKRMFWNDYFEKQTASKLYRMWANVSIVEHGYQSINTDDTWFCDTNRRDWLDSDGWVEG